MKEFNGFRSWNAWNVAVWIANDESLYQIALQALDRTNRNVRGNKAAVNYFMRYCPETRTPDGAVFNPRSVKTALLCLVDE